MTAEWRARGNSATRERVSFCGKKQLRNRATLPGSARLYKLDFNAWAPTLACARCNHLAVLINLSDSPSRKNSSPIKSNIRVWLLAWPERARMEPRKGPKTGTKLIIKFHACRCRADMAKKPPGTHPTKWHLPLEIQHVAPQSSISAFPTKPDTADDLFGYECNKSVRTESRCGTATSFDGGMSHRASTLRALENLRVKLLPSIVLSSSMRL
ncbi:uncharacterized protein K489DRAFT_17965 [Dissoconium aciculare CBS 342.82]|uniref:Uncharacterized protein n=1 Tax=Dissoconium aciculare CBS 342.82 TaxID=1314786 RepID=A0A6J3MHS8_9PEZI|nr:uncharacterized protein K489DRAFT_17965 [Dissoconium aciculare CBS 342.82]KAF1827490.1 hypothetical protein K489DRAFT_17965 [Dissoconium aciculare CBS 342.82]